MNLIGKFKNLFKDHTNFKYVNIAQSIGHIKRVIPNEDFGLVIEFRDGTFSLFRPQKLYDQGFEFLAYPHRLRHFELANDSITWHRVTSSFSPFKGGNLWHESAILDFQKIANNSEILEKQKLENQYIRLSMKNQAPTIQHASHHVYAVSMYPYSSEHMFCLAQSIHGGFGDHGPVNYYSLSELIENESWKNHFELSGCFWAIEIIESLASDKEKLINSLVTEVCQRAAA